MGNARFGPPPAFERLLVALVGDVVSYIEGFGYVYSSRGSWDTFDEDEDGGVGRD